MVKCVVAISGKRKSGKDYCTRILKQELEKLFVRTAVTGISNSLKMEFAKIHRLDYAELLSDGPYKEQYRKEMIKWGEDVRSRDSGLFCRAAIDPFVDNEVVIVSDCRRPSDYEFFTSNHPTLTIRVETSEENRRERGFRFVEGVDDGESECSLDGYAFDEILKNITGEDLSIQIGQIIARILNISDLDKCHVMKN
ncbi:unnamed protein product [Caenorhabditis sp. 36 PRJEB53466]|nr:unnamed protein product [Caenorhabditis sp. 36 PRJEB53466]